MIGPCVDTRCTHEDHCDTAHRRSAHRLAIVASPKLDASSLVRGVCSCGGYATSPGTTRQATIAHGHHADAKLAALAKTVEPCEECPAEVRDAVRRGRAAAAAGG